MGHIKKKIFIESTIEAVTGLHIGGSNLSMGIGGADAVVIRNALTNQPYIPGSSVKGKMRALTERLFGKFGNKTMGDVTKGPYLDTSDDIYRIIPDLYGKAAGEDDNIPSRLIVRDGYMTDDSVRQLIESELTDMPFTEVKTEVVIDRVTSYAMPRQLERVPGGTKFELRFILNILEGDDEKKLLDYVRMGLLLIEDDYLGGKGSRGSGEIKIDWKGMKVTYKTLRHYEKGLSAEVYNHNWAI